MDINKKYKTSEISHNRENILLLNLNPNLEETAKALNAQKEYHQARVAFNDGVIGKLEKEHFKQAMNNENNKGAWGDIRKLAKRNWWIRNVFSDKIFRELKAKGLILNANMAHNLVVTVGRAVISERLSGGTTYTGEVTDGALGDGVAPVFTDASTQLNTEVGRKASSDAIFDEQIAYIDFFFGNADVPNQNILNGELLLTVTVQRLMMAKLSVY